ncbi:uncharacterized protein LOC143929782 [Lithobates pipiens]
MAERQTSSEEESRSRRFKATNMAFAEMVEMVAIMTRDDYDGKHGPYLHPNLVKDQILTRQRRLRHQPRQDPQPHRNTQPRQDPQPHQDTQPRRDPQPHRNTQPRQDPQPHRKAQPHQDPQPRRDPQPHQDPEPHQPEWHRNPEEVEEREVEEVNTPDDVLFVDQQPEAFTTDSAQRLIGQIMAWNGEIDAMRNRLNAMQQEMKNMIDILGRI